MSLPLRAGETATHWTRESREVGTRVTHACISDRM
jgi:hypothetical protein